MAALIFWGEAAGHGRPGSEDPRAGRPQRAGRMLREFAATSVRYLSIMRRVCHICDCTNPCGIRHAPDARRCRSGRCCVGPRGHVAVACRVRGTLGNHRNRMETTVPWRQMDSHPSWPVSHRHCGPLRRVLRCLELPQLRELLRPHLPAADRCCHWGCAIAGWLLRSDGRPASTERSPLLTAGLLSYAHPASCPFASAASVRAKTAFARSRVT